MNECRNEKIVDGIGSLVPALSQSFGEVGRIAIGNKAQMHKTICMINQKGGCGKSSTCFHLAGTLASMGQRVLIVDTDPQGSISQGFFGPDSTHGLNAGQTVATLFDHDDSLGGQRNLVRASPIERVHIVSGNHHLSRVNTPLPHEAGMTQFILRDFLETLEAWDFVLIDCPPNLYQCSWNAMIAADYVVVPIPPEDFGTQGIRVVHQAVQSARLLNPRLTLLGNLVTRMDRRLLLHRAFESTLRETMGDGVFATVIPEVSAFKVALACRMPVEQYAPKSRAADAMRLLANEMITRIDMHERRRAA